MHEHEIKDSGELQKLPPKQGATSRDRSIGRAQKMFAEEQKNSTLKPN